MAIRACYNFFHKYFIIAGIAYIKKNVKYTKIALTPSYFLFLALVNLSIDVKPKDPNANKATASTRYSAGFISPWVKVLAISDTTSAKMQSKPPNLFYE